MLKLTEKYSDKPAAELPIFSSGSCRIRSTTTSAARKSVRRGPRCCRRLGKVMKRTMISTRSRLWRQNRIRAPDDPARQLEQRQIIGVIEQALERLPARQREAFLLRYWEELDVAEAAAAMGCSEGSVKTHCSRAVHALAAMLKAKGVRYDPDEHDFRQKNNHLPRPRRRRAQGRHRLQATARTGGSARAPRRPAARARTRLAFARAGSAVGGDRGRGLGSGPVWIGSR